jgi:hypothetical protein
LSVVLSTAADASARNELAAAATVGGSGINTRRSPRLPRMPMIERTLMNGLGSVKSE